MMEYQQMICGHFTRVKDIVNDEGYCRVERCMVPVAHRRVPA